MRNPFAPFLHSIHSFPPLLCLKKIALIYNDFHFFLLKVLRILERYITFAHDCTRMVRHSAHPYIKQKKRQINVMFN